MFRTDREPLEVEVFRVVNVGEYPELREAVLGGTLHRLDDGEVVDVPFIYHDPAEAQQFILVIPHGARARELSERAKLLDSLMGGARRSRCPTTFGILQLSMAAVALRVMSHDSDTMEVDITELEPVDATPNRCQLLPQPRGLAATSRVLGSRDDRACAPLIDDGELWIFVQVGEEDQDAFYRSEQRPSGSAQDG